VHGRAAGETSRNKVNGPEQSLTTRVAKVSRDEEYYLITKETKVTPRKKQDQHERTCGDSC
jgi:IS4 transposase